MEIINAPGFGACFALVLILIAIFMIVKNKKNKKEESEEAVSEAPAVQARTVTPLDINDEDATVACLVASIDYHNEIGKDVRVVSCREV